MYCKKCGSKLRDDAVFCLECGTSVKQEANTTIYNVNQSEKTTNRKKLLIPVLGCVVVAFVVVVAVIFGMKKSKDEPVASTETVEQESAEEAVEETVEDIGEESIEEVADPEEPKLILTKEVSYGSDGNPSGSYEYEYDSQGNMIKKIGYDRNGNKNTYEEWDSLGNSLKNLNYDNGVIYWGWECVCDSQGNNLREIHYQSGGSISSERVYSYDDAGNCIKIIDTSYYEDGHEEGYEIEFTYDTSGKCIKNVERRKRDSGEDVDEYEYLENKEIRRFTSYDMNGNIEHYFEEETRLEHDVQGNVIRKLDGDGNIVLWDEDIYDDEGKVIESIYFERSAMNYQDDRTEYIYDSNGYLIKEIQTSRNWDGTLWYINNIEYTNDDDGKVMKEILVTSTYSYTEGGSESVNDTRTEVEYNSEGVLIKRVSYDINGEMDSLYEYDDYGNLTKEVHSNRDGMSYLTGEFKYEYDEYGNVLKVTTYDDGEMSGYREYGYENIEEYAKKREMYKAILDNALTEQKNTDDLSILKYSYLFYDFNQDGCDELLLKKTEYYSIDTIYIYSLVENEIKLIAERSDDNRYEEISALMMNGIVVEGTVTNGCEYHHYIYELKEDGMELLADFHSYEYEEDMSNYEMNIAGEAITTTDRVEYNNIVNKYLEENVVVWLPYNSIRWNTLY